MILQRTGEALIQGRPRAGLVLLAGALASLGMLLVEGAGAAAAREYRPPFTHFDKLLHLAAHAWLTSLLVWGLALLPVPRRLRLRTPARLAAVAGLALSIALVAGLGVELAQKWLGAAHGRRFDWWDLAADAAGSLAALALFLAVATVGVRAYTGGK